MPAKLRHLIEIELLDDLQGKQVTAQDSDFGIEVGGIVVIHSGISGVTQILQHRIGLVDGDAADRVIDWGDSQSRYQRGAEDRRQCSQYHPLTLDKDAE